MPFLKTEIGIKQFYPKMKRKLVYQK